MDEIDTNVLVAELALLSHRVHLHERLHGLELKFHFYSPLVPKETMQELEAELDSVKAEFYGIKNPKETS